MVRRQGVRVRDQVQRAGAGLLPGANHPGGELWSDVGAMTRHPRHRRSGSGSASRSTLGGRLTVGLRHHAHVDGSTQVAAPSTIRQQDGPSFPPTRVDPFGKPFRTHAASSLQAEQRPLSSDLTARGGGCQRQDGAVASVEWGAVGLRPRPCDVPVNLSLVLTRRTPSLGPCGMRGSGSVVLG